MEEYEIEQIDVGPALDNRVHRAINAPGPANPYSTDLKWAMYAASQYTIVKRDGDYMISVDVTADGAGLTVVKGQEIISDFALAFVDLPILLCSIIVSLHEQKPVAAKKSESGKVARSA